MKTRSQQQVDLFMVFTFAQAETMMDMLNQVQDRLDALESVINRAMLNQQAASIPHDNSNIAKSLAPAWAEGGPLEFGKSANASELREFSRAWRKLISWMRTDPFKAEIILHGLNITVSVGKNGAKVFRRECEQFELTKGDEK